MEHSGRLFLPPTVRRHVSSFKTATQKREYDVSLNPTEAAARITAVGVGRRMYFFASEYLGGAVCVSVVELSAKTTEQINII